MFYPIRKLVDFTNYTTFKKNKLAFKLQNDSVFFENLFFTLMSVTIGFLNL